MASAASTAAPKLRQAALARELGVSRQAINDLVKRGVISVDRDNLIDVELARVAIINRVRPSGKTSDAVVNPPAPPAATAAPADQDVAVTSFHVARTLRETAEARLAQIALAEKRREVIQTAAVRTVLDNAFVVTREAILNIPARIAAQLAAETDAGAIQSILHAELHRALTTLAAAPSKLVEPDPDGGATSA